MKRHDWHWRAAATATAAATAMAMAWVVAGHAWAAHPFLTEDPGTLGAGRLELEFGLAAAQGDPGVNGRETVFAPQLAIGVTPTVDFIVQTFWIRQMPTQAPSLVGHGDTLADVKWRFFERDDLALAVRAGVDLPTGDSATGLGAGTAGFHAIAIADWTLGDYALYVNGAYARSRAPDTRANLGAVSVALTRPDDAPLRTFIEVAGYSSPDPANAQWPAFARVGVIYTVNAWLDVDAGFQARLNRSATRAAFLAGATVRW